MASGTLPHTSSRTPSRARWAVVGAYAAALTASTTTFLAYASVTPSVQRDFGVSEATVGNLALLSPLFLVLLGPLSGRLLDRRLDSTLIIGASMIAAGPAIRLINPSSYACAFVGQVVLTAGTPFVANAIAKVPARYFSPRERPTVIALLSASFYLGVLLAAVTAQPLYDAGGIALLVGIHAVFGAVGGGALLVMTLVRVRGSEPDADAAVSQGKLRTPELWRLGAVMFVAFGLFNAFVTWIETVQDHVGNAGFGGPLVIALTIGGVVGTLVVPGFVARRQARRPALVVIGVAQVLGFVALASTDDRGMLLAASAFIGFFMMAALPIAVEWSEIHAGDAHAASATAFLSILGNLGGVVFVLAPQAFLGSPRLTLTLLAALALPGVLASLRLPRTPTASARH